MTNRIHFPLQTLSVRALLVLALTASVLFQANAQSTDEDDASDSGQPFSNGGPPPGFVPPPPPNFSPPTTPPNMGAPGRPRVVATPSEDQLLQRPSSIIDPDDPEMAEVVGMIRIPEMGTNEVIEMLENFTRKPVLRQQTLPSVKITFFSQDVMTRSQAITALESLLALNGIAITNLGEDFLKAVPSQVINNQVARVWEGSTLDAIPSQTLYEKIFELDFLGTKEAADLLTPLMTGGAPLAFDKSNLILVTDSLINLQRIERMLPILDKPSKLRTEMLFFELQNISADEVADRIGKLVTGPLQKQLEGNTTVDADDRTNQLIVFTHPTNATLITELIERLDINVAPTTDTKIYSIRYADAVEVVDILEQIISGQREIRQDTAGGSSSQPNAAAAQAARERATQVRRSNQVAATARKEASNLQFSDFLTIVPDERANTIVANGTHSDLDYLSQLIDQIDSLLAQVRIEVIITEVSLNENDARGIDALGFTYSGTGFEFDPEGDESSWQVGGQNGENGLENASFYGLDLGASWTAGTFSFSAFLKAISGNGNTKILSAPTIVTTHNKEASVAVGQQRPVITGTTSTSSVTSTESDARTTRDTVQYKDINLELTVTPLIGSDGIVQMEIEQSVQKIIGNEPINGNEQPIIGNRSATSYVSVRDGGLIALGGLQESQREMTESRMAILGKLPVLGDLFTRNTEKTDRTELLIFIRPTILRSADDAHTDARDLIDNLEQTDAIDDYLEQGTFREKEEPEEANTGEREIPRRNQP